MPARANSVPGVSPDDRPTLRDVGALAGVSGAAVSYVLNGRATGQVGPETAQRILRAAAELGYRPNRAAQALRTRRHGIVGLVLAEVRHNIPPVDAMAGAHDEAQAGGRSLLVTNARDTPDGFRHAFDELLDRQVDAIVVAVAGTRQVALPPSTAEVPVLLANCFGQSDDVPCVLPDEEGGGRAAAQHVLDHGHRRIGFLAGLEGMWATTARVRGYRAAIAAAGLQDDPDLVRYGDYRMGSGYRRARELLALRSRPTALLCGNDRMAVGALQAVAEAGLRVPDDVSVMGYDDEPQIAADAVPALSTVLLPYEEMGRWAVRWLLDGDHQSLPPRTYLPCDVVPRDSVGPVPTR